MTERQVGGEPFSCLVVPEIRKDHQMDCSVVNLGSFGALGPPIPQMEKFLVHNRPFHECHISAACRDRLVRRMLNSVTWESKHTITCTFRYLCIFTMSILVSWILPTRLANKMCGYLVWMIF